MPEVIIRIAAKGDGVTASGRFAPRAAPGDVLLDDGALQPGPHRVDPICRHFATCGGCQLQHCDEETLAQFVADRVRNAAEGQGLAAAHFAPTHLSPPNSRRRASLRAESKGGKVVLGYSEARSHRLVDLAECPVLVPELAALLIPVRKLLARQGGRLAVEMDCALTDQGVDLAIKGLKVEGLPAMELMLDFARLHGLARLTIDQGYGYESLWEPEPVTVTLSGVAVPCPPGAFLQATKDGEEALVAAAREWLETAGTVADLFSGLGTFAFALAGPTRVLAAEADRNAHLACKTAAGLARRPVFASHRDLFRNPLLAEELNKFDAVLLDPPRAGAEAQVMRLADSTVPRIVYISCNPSSWARDAARLVAGGYRVEEVRAIGQFRWSTHVELVSLLVRSA